jgi:hypothetical protein
MTAAVEVSGVPATVERIAGIEARAADCSPALAVVADLLEAQVDRAFTSRGASIGRPWPPLAASTLKARARRWGYYGRVAPRGATTIPLDWSGRLRTGFAQGSGDHVRQIGATTLRWGSLVPYAGYLQPRFPMLGFRDVNQANAILREPVRLWVQGVPAGALATVARARAGL